MRLAPFSSCPFRLKPPPNDHYSCAQPSPETVLSEALTPLFPGLYAKGRVTGFKRGKRNQRVHTSLVQIEGVANKEEAQFYLGKVGLR